MSHTPTVEEYDAFLKKERAGHPQFIPEVDGVIGRLHIANVEAARDMYAIVREAVNAERDRCAKIAEAIEDSMAEAIAERIRSGE